MTTKDTGEQAFPSVPAFPSSHELMGDKGMTLRDYFAAKALQGMYANCGPDTSENHRQITAKWCYEMADAMLKAREV